MNCWRSIGLVEFTLVPMWVLSCQPVSYRNKVVRWTSIRTRWYRWPDQGSCRNSAPIRRWKVPTAADCSSTQYASSRILPINSRTQHHNHSKEWFKRGERKRERKKKIIQRLKTVLSTPSTFHHQQHQSSIYLNNLNRIYHELTSLVSKYH